MPLPCRRCDASCASQVLESLPEAAPEAAQVSEHPKRAMSCQRLAFTRLLLEPLPANSLRASISTAFCRNSYFSTLIC